MKTKSHLIYGVPAALLSVIAFVASSYSAVNPMDSLLMTWGPRLLLLAAVVLSTLDYKKKVENHSFGNLFANGFRTTAVITVILTVSVGIFIATAPGIKDKFMAEAAANALKEGYPKDGIKEAQEMMQRTFVPMTMAGVVLSTLVTGAIFSAISALILKKQ